jgi:hypothetical protein
LSEKGVGWGGALAAWRAAKRVRSTEPKASPEGSGGFSRNAQRLIFGLFLVLNPQNKKALTQNSVRAFLF